MENSGQRRNRNRLFLRTYLYFAVMVLLVAALSKKRRIEQIGIIFLCDIGKLHRCHRTVHRVFS